MVPLAAIGVLGLVPDVYEYESCDPSPVPVRVNTVPPMLRVPGKIPGAGGVKFSVNEIEEFGGTETGKVSTEEKLYAAPVTPMPPTTLDAVPLF